MNPEFPPNNPRVELEAKLTAFILGELPVHEAAALRQAMEDDAELAALYEQLKTAHKLLREATASPVEQTQATPTPLKLSEERRQKLLAQFKTVAPKEFAREKQKPRAGTRILEIAAVMAIVAVLAGLLLPSLAKSKSKATSVAIRYRLKAIDSAKQMWAQDNHKSDGDIPTASDIAPYMGRGDGTLQNPIAGETYQIGRVGESPSAELPEKSAFGPRQRRISLGGETAYAGITNRMSGQPVSTPAPAPPPQSPEVKYAFAEDLANENKKLKATDKSANLSSTASTSIVLPPAENSANSLQTMIAAPSAGPNFYSSGYYDTSGGWNIGSVNGTSGSGGRAGSNGNVTFGNNVSSGIRKPNSEFRFYNDLNANGAVDAPTRQSQFGLVDPATGLPVISPQVEVRAKFADVTDAADRALGFNWKPSNATVPLAIATPQKSTDGKDGLANPEVTTESGKLAVMQPSGAFGRIRTLTNSDELQLADAGAGGGGRGIYLSRHT